MSVRENKGNELLEEIVESYVKDKSVQLDVQKRLKSQIIDEVRTSIIEDEKNNIKREVLKEEDAKITKKHNKSIGIIAIEAVILSFIVGLIVNQATNLIDLWGQNPSIYIIVLIALLLILFIALVLILNNRINKKFNK